MPLILDAPPPAIIHRAPIAEVRFGLSYAVISRVEYDDDIKHMPRWALEGMLLVPVFAYPPPLVTTLTFLTATSATDQTWSVLADWNISSNVGQVVSHGADGGSDGGNGGGGGGYAKTLNLNLTPSGSAKYRLRAGNSGSGVGSACWLGDAGTTSLATSLVGIQGAGGTTGGVITSAIGSTKRAGGNGEISDSSFNGGGGGAAGPNGAGGDGNSGGLLGGDADGGTVPGGVTGNPGSSGTEFDASHGCGSGASTPAPGGGEPGRAGGLYGGGGAAGAPGGAGAQALIVIQNN
jgi:hypothetical protein